MRLNYELRITNYELRKKSDGAALHAVCDFELDPSPARRDSGLIGASPAQIRAPSASEGSCPPPKTPIRKTDSQFSEYKTLQTT